MRLRVLSLGESATLRSVIRAPLQRTCGAARHLTSNCARSHRAHRTGCCDNSSARRAQGGSGRTSDGINRHHGALDDALEPDILRHLNGDDIDIPSHQFFEALFEFELLNDRLAVRR